MANDVSAETIAEHLSDLFATEQDAPGWISLPHDSGITSDDARVYGRPVTPVRTKPLAELLLLIDQAPENDFSFSDVFILSELLREMSQGKSLAGLEGTLEDLSMVAWIVPNIRLFEDDLDDSPAATGQVWGITTSSEGMELLLTARVGPRELFEQASPSPRHLTHTAERHDLPIWVCHWIVNNEWRIPSLSWIYDDEMYERTIDACDPMNDTEGEEI